MVTREQVMEALKEVQDPELKRDLVSLGMVSAVDISEDEVRVTLALTSPNCPMKDRIVSDARQAVLKTGAREVTVGVVEMSPEHKQRLSQGSKPSGGAAELNQVRHVLAVMSGKGGVGKSMVSGMLALALRRAGHRVGILDADITGPSIPKMFFPNPPRPESSPTAILPPRSRSDIAVMSINLLLEAPDQAVIWRGPLIGRAIQQFWGDVLWGELDYLVVDLPPGTSDAPLTVMQSLPLSGIVLVTTPQDLAGMVVRKAAQMARQLNVAILGLIENMSVFVCPDNGKEYAIFGPSHAQEIAAAIGTPLLGRLPILPEASSLCDSGRIDELPDEPFARIAEQIIASTPPARAPIFPTSQASNV